MAEERKKGSTDSQQPDAPRFPKPGKRPWRTAWRAEQPRNTKDAYLFLAMMAAAWIITIGMIIWWRLG